MMMMERKTQTPNRANTNTITVIGDSQSSLSDAAGLGVPPYRTWGKILSEYLNADGCNVETRIFGSGGDTTSQMIGRSKILHYYDTPKLGVVYGGVNDPFSNTTGTAAAGSSTTITLASPASTRINSYVGLTINITSGTGSGQSRTITAYSTTRIATVYSNWSVTPNATSVYSISAPTQSQMQANHQALIKILKYKVKGLQQDALVTLWSQTQLPSGGIIGARYVILNDTSITGGCGKSHQNQNDTITGNFSLTPTQSVWEYRNARSGESGWGRVAIAGTPAFSDGCSKVISIGSNYLNYPSGGDNYNVSANTGSKYEPYVAVNAATQNAATEEGTIYCNLYGFQSNLIYGGVFQGQTVVPETTQGSSDYHVASTDQHHGLYGNETVARAVYYTIKNQSGWISDLSQ